MKKIVINGHVVEYNTVSELADIMQVMGVSAAPAKGGKKATGKAAPQPEAEKVEFVKRNGEKLMVSPKQAAAMEKWRSNSSGKTLDEVKALKPEITDAGREYVKAHPGCTRKEAAANGCKNITKDGLKGLKRELGVR